jgi:Predicted transcriptional regulators containing the CopG/Arc/MetJ DNA-binding domain and a metal-binding domain
MERLTISLNNQLAKQFDSVMHKRGYFNRSEAMRDLIRDLLDTVRLEEHIEDYCVATLSYIYTPELASGITATQHRYRDLIVSTMDVHMDHDNCLEVTILSGTIRNVKKFANHIISMQGVRHGKLHLLPVEIAQESNFADSVPHADGNVFA